MYSTPPSLLQKLGHPDDPDAWRIFVQLYTPLLYRWASRAGLRDHDAADLLQDVFTTLVRKLPDFQYDRHKSFRAWLRTVTLNQWRDNRRRRERQPPGGNAEALDHVADAAEHEDICDAEYLQYLVGRALRLMQADFEPTTWQACWEFVVRGRPAIDVARDLGISENAVYIAKYRVLRHLRQELVGLIDESTGPQEGDRNVGWAESSRPTASLGGPRRLGPPYISDPLLCGAVLRPPGPVPSVIRCKVGGCVCARNEWSQVFSK